MSISRIPDAYLDTTISIYGMSQTRDSVGEATVTESIKYDNIPAHIQPHDLSTSPDIRYELYGVVHYRTHYCFFNRYADNLERTIEPLDIVADLTTGRRYSILSIEEKKEFTASQGTHVRLILEYVSKGSTFFERQTATTKGNIANFTSQTSTSKANIAA